MDLTWKKRISEKFGKSPQVPFPLGASLLQLINNIVSSTNNGEGSLLIQGGIEIITLIVNMVHSRYSQGILVFWQVHFLLKV